MKILSSAVLLYLFGGIAAFGQRDETLFGESGLRLTGAWGGTQLGFSSLLDENVMTRGGFGGAEFNKMVLIGYGGMQSEEVSKNESNHNSRYKLEYGGLLIGFTPRAFKVVHPKFSFMMGGGEIKQSGDVRGNDDVFVVQPGAGGEINVFKWFRLGLEGSYLFVSNSDFEDFEDGDFSAFAFEMKLRFGWSWGK